MYHVSAQGVDERMINVHYCYYTIILSAVRFRSQLFFFKRSVLGWSRQFDHSLRHWQLFLLNSLCIYSCNYISFVLVRFSYLIKCYYYDRGIDRWYMTYKGLISTLFSLSSLITLKETVNMVFNVTETIRLIRDGKKGGKGYGGGGRGRLFTYRYTVTTRMIPSLRWVAMRAILMFH